MATMFFLMQHHNPTPEQAFAAGAKFGVNRAVALCAAPDPAKGQGEPVAGVEYFGKAALLTVPDNPDLSREWFEAQAFAIVKAIGGFAVGDVLHASGQSQLVNALNAYARAVGVRLVESVTKRESEDQTQSDGSVKKVSIFRFVGFRPVYKF